MLFKNLISTAYRIFFKRKTSPIIATNTELHFNDFGLSRPNKRKLLCWQIFHIVDRFHATSANFTQRRITPRAQTKRKVTQTNRNIHFKHKNPKQKPCDHMNSPKEEFFLLRFSQKEQTSNKVYRFSDK